MFPVELRNSRTSLQFPYSTGFPEGSCFGKPSHQQSSANACKMLLLLQSQLPASLQSQHLGACTKGHSTLSSLLDAAYTSKKPAGILKSCHIMYENLGGLEPGLVLLYAWIPCHLWGFGNWGPHNKDYSILGSILGSQNLGKLPCAFTKSGDFNALSKAASSAQQA